MDENTFNDGEAYELMMGRWSRVVGKEFLTWLDIPKGQRWLDAGCGNGAFTEELIARAAPAAVIGVDPSEGQLDYARKRSGTTLAQFQIGDAQALSFADDSFDVGVMALVVAFLPHPAKAVEGLTRVVRPGGCVATYMWEIPEGVPVNPLYDPMISMGIEPPLPPNPGVSKPSALLAYWKNAGLASVATKVLRIPVTFPSFEEFWTSMTLPIGPQGKMITSMAADKRNELRRRVRDHVRTTDDGRVEYESYAHAIKGRVP